MRHAAGRFRDQPRQRHGAALPVEPIVVRHVLAHELGFAGGVVKGVHYVVDVGRANARETQDGIERLAGKPGVHLLPAQAFFGNGVRHDAVDHQRDRGVFVERRYSEDDHGFDWRRWSRYSRIVRHRVPSPRMQKFSTVRIVLKKASRSATVRT